MSTTIIRVTRTELYKQVWSEPMVKLAKKFGLSDVGLRKKCKKLNIPLPVIGYWQKKEYGKAKPPPPLPSFDGDEEIEFHIHIEKEKSRPVDEEQYKEAQNLIAFEKQDENRINVPPTLSSLHPYVALTKKAFENTETSRSGQYKDFLSAGGRKHLNIHVSKNCFSRALRIMNTLIKAMEARGFEVSIVTDNKNEHYSSYKTCVSVLGQNIEFGLREPIKQKRRMLTPAEIKESPRAGEYEYDRNPSGKLILEIKTWNAPRNNWSDAKIQRVEGCLNDFIIVLIKTAVELRTWKIEREQAEHKRQKLERQREELARFRREEEVRLQCLVDEAAGWQKSKQIREYIKVVKEEVIRKNGKIKPESDLGRWLTWANQQADRFDPLVESPPSVLDRDYKFDLD